MVRSLASEVPLLEACNRVLGEVRLPLSEVLPYSGGALSQGPTARKAIARRLGLPYGAVHMLPRSAGGGR